VPGMQIVVPGHPAELDALFQETYANGRSTYFRLSEKSNASPSSVEFGRASILRTGTQATVIAVGPALDDVLRACSDMNVTILYYTSVEPFDIQTIVENCSSAKVLLCEPFYSGALDYDIIRSAGSIRVRIEHVGVPHVFLTHYGSSLEQDYGIGVTPENIRRKLETLINE